MGVVGCGVIGTGVVDLIVGHNALIERRSGLKLALTAIADRDPARLKAAHAPGAALLDDAFALVKRDDVDVVVELMGGVEVADKVVRAALEAKKHVVTANKALLAERGPALFELAEQNGCDLYFEAAVAGGIPVIRSLREALVADRIDSVCGIINGTSNYILSSMANDGAEFNDALKAAQEAGFAEADPTLDISGGDAGHKLAILAGLAFGVQVSPKQIPTEGIDRVGSQDIGYARDFGFVFRPLAVARRLEGDQLDLRVHPALVPEKHPLAHVDGALNAVAIEGAKVGPSFLSGLGAGAGPTATSVVGDIVDIGKNMRSGSASRRWPQASADELSIQPIENLRSRYFLRCTVKDESGVLAAITGKLGDFNVSIEKMVQDDDSDRDGLVTIVMLTHEALEKDIVASLKAIDATDLTTQDSHVFRVMG